MPAQISLRTLRRITSGGVALAWGANFVLLLGIAAWTYLDRRATLLLSALFDQLGWLPAGVSSSPLASALLPLETSLRWALAGVAVSLGLMVAGLWFGSPRARSLKAWLLVTTLACGWLGLHLSWPEVAWRGRQFRLALQLAQIDPLREEFTLQWPPAADHPDLGAFLAYPHQEPITLLLMQNATFPGTDVEFSAIDRTRDGVIRFQLAGMDRGTWLEWRPNPSAPTSFRSGLETIYIVDRFSQLAPHWYQVRYTAALVPPQP